MSKLVSKININALFLASILVVGIIGISSFTAYGEIYQNANCDNTNVNINGINQEQIQRQSENYNFEPTVNGEDLKSDEEEGTLNTLTGTDDSQSLLNIEKNIVNICINPNDNVQEVTVTQSQEQGQGGGNGDGPTTCEECFEEKLSDTSLNNFLGFLSGVGWGLTEFCNALADQEGEGAIELAVTLNLKVVSISDSEIQAVIQCLKDIGFIPPPST